MIMWKAWNDKLTSTYLYSAVAVGSVEDYNGIQLIVLVLQLDILIQSHSSPVLWFKKKNSLWKLCQEQATNRQSKQLAGGEYGAFIKWGASHFYLWQIYLHYAKLVFYYWNSGCVTINVLKWNEIWTECMVWFR